MNDYEINQMIIDDNFDSEEYVTAQFLYQDNQYSITFKKADLEIINSWIYKEGTSLPSNLPDKVIDSIRDDVKMKLD